jgi:succinate dehydrogenase/fumarate reductase flavoprotein subunit
MLSKGGILVNNRAERYVIEGLANLAGLNPATLKKTIDDYNAAVRGAPDRFGRKIFAEPIDKPPFYAMTVTPGASQSGGGIRTDSRCRILKKDGSSIANVYAVGEMVGGLRSFGYAGGDSLAHCVVSGRIAGQEAAKDL